VNDTGVLDLATLHALAEPNRLRIVELLRDGPRAVGDVAERLTMRQPQASRHLKVLAEAGIVSVRPHAQSRVYQLEAEPFRDLEAWLDTFSGIWDARLDALESYLQTLRPPGGDHDA
jgi:DNA-binding transcriptional ArsR family regulator